MTSLNSVKKNETYGFDGAYNRPSDTESGNDVSDDLGLGDSFEIESGSRDLEDIQRNGSLSSDSSPFEDFGNDELPDSDATEEGSIQQQISALKEQIKKNDKLDDKTKEELLSKLDDAADLQSINIDKAQEKLDALEEEVEIHTMYSPAALRLDKELGLGDPAAVQEMLDKHGIDGSSANLDPDKLAALLSDPMISEAVSEQQEAHKSAYKAMTDMVPKKASEAHAVNAATDLKDSSAVVDTDTSSFKWLYDTAQGTSEEAKEVLKTGVALAEKKAKILSALTNEKIEADPDQPGMIKLPAGGSFNAVENTAGGPAIEWPKIEAVPFHGDWEGDGQTAVPEWMRQAHYPYHSTDDGGWNPMGLVAAGVASIYLAPLVGASAIATGTGGGVAGDLMAYEPENPY